MTGDFLLLTTAATKLLTTNGLSATVRRIHWTSGKSGCRNGKNDCSKKFFHRDFQLKGIEG